MKCWIKKFKIKDDKKVFMGYFNNHIGLSICSNHWVQLRQEAKKFFDGRKANATIRKYKLKDCEVEYDERQR